MSWEYEEKKVTITKRVNERLICDVCGRNISAYEDEENVVDNADLDVEHFTCPEYGDGELLEGNGRFHICGPCVRGRIFPMMDGEGGDE